MDYYKSTIWITRGDPEKPIEICDYFPSRDEAKQAIENALDNPAMSAGATVVGFGISDVRSGTNEWYIASKKLDPLLQMSIESQEKH